MDQKTYRKYMKAALKEAYKAAEKEEIPVGAVIVKDGKIIAKAHNERETKNDATLHAEITAIKKACKKLKSWRLTGCEIYVTLEPCPMCAGAIVLARFDTLVFGAYDKKSGACGSVFEIPQNIKLNHNPSVISGILEEECGSVLSDFFKKLRKMRES